MLRPTARPPAGEQARWAEPGSMDGWGVWPPGAFDVTLTAYGRADLHESILWRCDLADWWPCTKATRDALKSGPDGGASPVPSHRNTFKGSPLTRAREAQVRRALGHYLERLAAREDGGPAPLSLLTTLNLDLAGDGNPVRVYNVAITGFQVRESDAEYLELPGELYFLFREQDGEMVRLELTGKVPLGEPDFPIDGAVLGTFDIDGDGVPELWLDVPYVEGTTWQIVHPVNGRLERLASLHLRHLICNQLGAPSSSRRRRHGERPPALLAWVMPAFAATTIGPGVCMFSSPGGGRRRARDRTSRKC